MKLDVLCLMHLAADDIIYIYIFGLQVRREDSIRETKQFSETQGSWFANNNLGVPIYSLELKFVRYSCRVPGSLI